MHLVCEDTCRIIHLTLAQLFCTINIPSDQWVFTAFVCCKLKHFFETKSLINNEPDQDPMSKFRGEPKIRDNLTLSGKLVHASCASWLRNKSTFTEIRKHRMDHRKTCLETRDFIYSQSVHRISKKRCEKNVDSEENLVPIYKIKSCAENLVPIYKIRRFY